MTPTTVTFHCDDPLTELATLLGPERPDVSSGYGGWEEVERPRRSTAITWKGQPARRFAVNVLLDNFAEGTSIEADIRRLEKLALPRSGGQPPTVTVSAPGGVIPTFYEGMRWVVEALSWGDALMNTYNNRTRQAVTVTLLQAVADDLIKRSPAKDRKASDARAKGSGKGAKNKRYTVKRGDTLSKIAAKQLGSAKRWREIAKLNNIRDPKNVKVGRVLKLP